MENLKLNLLYFIKYYREDLGNISGGSLHICLDDGNLSQTDLIYCQNFAKEEGDYFGYFLATLMLEFTEGELDKFYNNGWA